MMVLIESVRHHVPEQEEELFKLVRDAFSVEELNDMGDRMERIRAAAPTRPHPLLPDVPPLNLGRQLLERLVTRRARARAWA